MKTKILLILLLVAAAFRGPAARRPRPGPGKGPEPDDRQLAGQLALQRQEDRRRFFGEKFRPIYEIPGQRQEFPDPGRPGGAQGLHVSRSTTNCCSGDFSLPRLGRQLLRQRVLQVQGFCREILAKPFDFSLDEQIELDADKRETSRDLSQLRAWWQQVAEIPHPDPVHQPAENSRRRRRTAR